MMIMRSTALSLLFVLTVAMSPAAQQSGQSPARAGSIAGPRYGTWGADLTAMDTSVKPGDSFWHFVNGSWDKRTEIPADRANAGVGVLLLEEAERQVRAIIEDMARNAAATGKIGQQIGDLTCHRSSGSGSGKVSFM